METLQPSGSGLVLPVAIAAVSTDVPEYDRREWRHWSDEDGDCQNARQEVLIAESTVSVSFETDEQCRVKSGKWIGPYTGEVVEDPADLDVDHVVPLANAHRSGAWRWDRDRKQDYANSLDYDNHLVATTSSANRSKGAKGPEEWRPPLEEYWCRYAVDWATIKNRWGLTVTEAEYAALSEMLGTCESSVLLRPTPGSTPQPPPGTESRSATTTVPPGLPTDLRYDPFGPDRDCGDFDSYEEALAFYLAAGGPESDPHRLDDNDDGEPCESLRGGPSAQALPPEPQTGSGQYSANTGPDSRQLADCIPAGSYGPAGRLLPSGLGVDSPSNDCPSVVIPLPFESTTALTNDPSAAPSLVPASDTEPEDDPAPETPKTPPPGIQFTDHDCVDFSTWQDARALFVAEGGPGDDPHGLDRDDDSVACRSLPGSTEGPSVATGSRPPADTPAYRPEPESIVVAALFVELPFDPFGPDRNCDDFSNWWDAQNFYLAAEGAEDDPHGLDHNGDGVVCQELRGAPKDGPEPPTAGTGLLTEATFADRNCSDFATWREAQDFYIGEGGPQEDPHRLNPDGDAWACESLPGAPGSEPEPPGEEDGSTPEPAPIVDRNCSDFTTWRSAQDFYLEEGGPREDPHGLDRNGDGVACESLPGAPVDEPEPPTTQNGENAKGSAFVDRNCSDFDSWRDAQDFFLAEGGPNDDPHRLDRDGDGTACESLPGAPNGDTS